MEVKRNLVRREATEEEIRNLVYPKDNYDLLKVDYVDEWDRDHGDVVTKDSVKRYFTHHKAVHITVRCKKCGRVTKEATDRADMSCKFGPCNIRWVDLTGRKIGKLTVEGLERRKLSERQKNDAWYWKCRCECGAICYRPSVSLLRSISAACSACGRQQAIEKTRLPNGLSKWHRMIRVYKKNAKMYEREFTLSEDEFISVASNPCIYCGSEPVLSSYGVICNGVDRVDNSKGYIPGNVAACCSWCNIMKGKHSKDDFLAHVRAITEHCGLKLNDHPEMEYTSSEVEMGTGRDQ